MRKSRDRMDNYEKMVANFIRCYADSGASPLKILLKLFRGYSGRVVLGAICYAIKVSPLWVIPIVTANTINIATNRPPDSVQQLIWNFVVIIVLLSLNIPFHTLYVKTVSYARRNVEAGLRAAMVRKLQELSIRFYQEMQSGRISSKIMRDVEAVEALSAQVTETGFSIILNLTVSLGVVFFKNKTVFLFFLICVPVAAFITVLFQGKMRKSNSELRQEVEHTSAEVMEMVELIPVTRAHAVEKQEIDRLTKRLQQIAQKGLHLDVIQNLFGAVSWVMFNIFQIICLFTAGYLAYRGEIDVGDIALYQTYFASVVGQVSAFFGLLPTLSKGAESIRSIGEILSSGDVEQTSGKTKVQKLHGEFIFQDVCFHYPDADTKVINHLNLKVKPGETIALVGGSGAGKSTVLNMVIGFYKPDSGVLSIDGMDINDLDLKSYRKQIAVVPQTSILFSGTIRENITYGKSNVTEERLMEVVRAANLEEFIQSLPNGLDTMVGEHGGNLSGGQRQRISIARAIIRNPQVIIFDEATSALDSISENRIQSAINNMSAGRTTFIVAHRLSTIRNADRIAVLKDGHCVEIGSYDELMEKKGEFYQLKTLQS